MTKVAVPDRAQWVDIAKALSILLVVFHHAIFAWSDLVKQLDVTFTYFRMPIFFFASGMFITKMMALDAPAFVARRLFPLLYIFVVWSIIKWAFIDLFRYVFIRGDLDATPLLWIFIDPPQTLWFIYALAIFSLLAWKGRKFPKWIVTAIAAVCALIPILVGPLADGLFVPKLARFFVWFWLGYVLSDAARARAARPISSLALLIVPAWMVASFMILNSNENAQAWALPLTITALPVGFVLAVFLDQSPVGERLAWIGKRTLPIYVGHFIALSLMGKAFERFDLPKGVPATAATAAIAVAFALSAKWIADRVGFKWLYDLPMSWRRRLEATLRSFKKHSNSEANAQVLH